MIFRCPGQDDRNIKAGSIRCPACGYVLEIFSDEIKAGCPQCKAKVYRQRLPSCVDWCKSGRECIGGEKWNQLRGGRKNVL